MGVAGAASRQTTATPRAKENRRKTSKSQSRYLPSHRSAAVVVSKKQKKRKEKVKESKPLGPGTRPGSHQQFPITIDSDDESDSAESMETSASAAVRAYSMPATPINRSRVFSNRQWTPNTSTLRFQPYLVDASPASSYANDSIELTLADITDCNLRQETARLMAVAPGLPVADIYHLLMERRVHFEAAKQDVIRQSQRPFATQRPQPQTRAATFPSTRSDDIQRDVENDTYIKIDFDDPEIIFDKDAPTESLPESSRQRRPSQARPKKSAKKSTVKSSKGRVAGDINRGMRETSYDRSVIVPDEEVLEDADETYSESDNADVDMTDDGTDLTIDMEPEFSYNSDILSGPMSR
ncbi:hypothetical protein E8E12_004789 [Didymella heteroderae]|uniref:Uncharacterized protein n=1 Tax=Didymella heteroderae TaxID=1769908 RepID=A0A9P4WU72_9PLEO|nr:hypothetical protein E8E12_004789 [Didymella heteroderae]